MNYEFYMLNHVGVVAKRVCAAAAAAETAAHEGDDNTPSDPTGRGVKNGFNFLRSFFFILWCKDLRVCVSDHKETDTHITSNTTLKKKKNFSVSRDVHLVSKSY